MVLVRTHYYAVLGEFVNGVVLYHLLLEFFNLWASEEFEDLKGEWGPFNPYY